MSELSQELLNKFSQLINSQNSSKSGTDNVIYGEAIVKDGEAYVKVDGSDIETPCDTAVTIKNGDRVKVELRNHSAVITSNMSDKSASSNALTETNNNLADTILVVDGLNATTIRTDNFSAKIAQISDADIASLSARTVNADSVTTAIVNATDVQAETIGSRVVNAETIKAAVADVGYLTADKIEAETGDFLKIRSDKLDADIALLRDVVIEDATIKGTLDAININAANIVAGQLIVDRFIKHDLETDTYRVLELDDEGQEHWGTINGDVLTEYSINANKINVADLFAQNIVVYNKFYSDNYEPSEYKQYSVLIKKPSDWDDETGNSYYVYSESEEDYVEITRPFSEFEAWKYYKFNVVPMGKDSRLAYLSKSGMLMDFESSDFKFETPYFAVNNGKMYATGGAIFSSDYSRTVGSRYTNSGIIFDVENKEISSENFAIDSDGKMYAKAGYISGIELTDNGFYAESAEFTTYDTYEPFRCYMNFDAYANSGGPAGLIGVVPFKVGVKNSVGDYLDVFDVRLGGHNNYVSVRNALFQAENSVISGTLILSKTQDASGTSDNQPALIVGGTVNQAHLEFDGNEIMAKSNATSVGALTLNNEGGNVNLGKVTVNDGVAQYLVCHNKSGIVQKELETSNYVQVIRWYRGGSNAPSGQYNAHIGHHSTGNTDGAIVLLPYFGETDHPYNANVGLYLSKTRFRFNGTEYAPYAATGTFTITSTYWASMVLSSSTTQMIFSIPMSRPINNWVGKTIKVTSLKGNARYYSGGYIENQSATSPEWTTVSGITSVAVTPMPETNSLQVIVTKSSAFKYGTSLTTCTNNTVGGFKLISMALTVS